MSLCGRKASNAANRPESASFRVIDAPVTSQLAGSCSVEVCGSKRPDKPDECGGAVVECGVATAGLFVCCWTSGAVALVTIAYPTSAKITTSPRAIDNANTGPRFNSGILRNMLLRIAAKRGQER